MTPALRQRSMVNYFEDDPGSLQFYHTPRSRSGWEKNAEGAAL